MRGEQRRLPETQQLKPGKVTNGPSSWRRATRSIVNRERSVGDVAVTVTGALHELGVTRTLFASVTPKRQIGAMTEHMRLASDCTPREKPPPERQQLPEVGPLSS
ncbi:hypothetical protein H180DRAFT_00473 [Streptomyces sp. WMMB 322]|nr:hypothetical protein H180DRAFT_00473 [Streptomyces sp. WMMB 322]